MQAITVAHVGDFAPQATNGVAMAGWWLARAQANLGARVFLYRAGRNRGDEILVPGIIRRTFSSSSNWVDISHDLYKWVMQNRDRVHLLHLHSVFTPLNTHLARACRKAHLPYILTPHGGYDRNIFLRGWIKKKLYFNLFERRLLHGARGIHCVAAPEVNDIRRLGCHNAIVVAPNILNMSELLALHRNPRRRVIWLGRWDVHHKGLDRLFRVWGILERSLPDFELHLYGAGREKHKVETLASRSGATRIFIHPPVYGSEKLAILTGAELYIQPSRWEVFGMGIAEAMAAGIPVALSRGCYIAHDVFNNGAGLILPDNDSEAADSLAGLLLDSPRRAEMGRNGRAFVQRFCDETSAGMRLIDFYRRILSPS